MHLFLIVKETHYVVLLDIANLIVKVGEETRYLR